MPFFYNITLIFYCNITISTKKLLDFLQKLPNF